LRWCATCGRRRRRPGDRRSGWNRRAAIEHLDRRCLQLLREDGADRAQSISIPDDTDLPLIVQLELPADDRRGRSRRLPTRSVIDPGTPPARFARLLAEHGAFDRTELATPGDTRRAKQMLDLREAAPTGANRRVGDAKRLDSRIDKTAGDIVVPFEHFEDMLAIYRKGYEERGLNYAIWGHISDGNVHPNVIPRTYEDVVAGREAILEFGREAWRGAAVRWPSMVSAAARSSTDCCDCFTATPASKRCGRSNA
jgi:D-lactate dehydrogenase (cytochrome)